MQTGVRTMPGIEVPNSEVERNIAMKQGQDPRPAGPKEEVGGDPVTAQGLTDETLQNHSTPAAAAGANKTTNEPSVPENNGCGCATAIKGIFKMKSQTSDLHPDSKAGGSSVAVPQAASSESDPTQTLLSGNEKTTARSVQLPANLRFSTLPRATVGPPKGTPSPIHN